MLEEFAAASDMRWWAVGSLLFFIVVYVILAVRTIRARRDDMRARASLPFEPDEDDHG